MCMLKPSILKTTEPQTSMAGYGNYMMWMTTNNMIRLYWYDVTLPFILYISPPGQGLLIRN